MRTGVSLLALRGYRKQEIIQIQHFKRLRTCMSVYCIRDKLSAIQAFTFRQTIHITVFFSRYGIKTNAPVHLKIRRQSEKLPLRTLSSVQRHKFTVSTVTKQTTATFYN